MSAAAISLADFADAFADAAVLELPDIHPGGARVIWSWLREMHTAAETERADDVAELASRITDKVALERERSCANV
jgi:hypothetical protein